MPCEEVASEDKVTSLLSLLANATADADADGDDIEGALAELLAPKISLLMTLPSCMRHLSERASPGGEIVAVDLEDLGMLSGSISVSPRIRLVEVSRSRYEPVRFHFRDAFDTWELIA